MSFARTGYLQVLAAMLIWGSVGIFVRYAGQPAPVIVFVRVATALIAMGAYMFFRRRPVRLGADWRMALVSGLFLSLNWLFFFLSIQATTIGNAVLTYYLAPIFSIIWARIFLGERLEAGTWKALALAFAGIALDLRTLGLGVDDEFRAAGPRVIPPRGSVAREGKQENEE